MNSDAEVRRGFNWLTELVDFCAHGNESSGFIKKRWGVSRVAERLLASYDELRLHGVNE
jgi:hypothetical protein